MNCVAAHNRVNLFAVVHLTSIVRWRKEEMGVLGA